MPNKRALTAPEPPIRTFDEAFAEHTLTPAERAALVWHLAALRARKTVEALLPGAVSLSKALGHITRADLLRAGAAIEKKD